MALKRKKLLVAIKEACAVFGIVAAIVGTVFGIIGTVGYFGLPMYVIPITVCVLLFVAIVITTYRDQ
jgi:hypothetical protein